MPSAVSFLRTLREGLWSLWYAYCAKDKLNIIVTVILGSFPSIEQKIPILRKSLRNIRNSLIRNVIVNVNGIRYVLIDLDSLFILSLRCERYVWNYLKPKKGDVFIDVGAHVGKYTLRVARIVGEKGQVIAVEPHPENYRALLKGTKLNGLKNVIALNIAAYSEDKKLRLFISYAASGHSISMRALKIKQNGGSGYIEAEAKTLDHVLEKLNARHVDWIKIDVEGAELEVLKGLKNTLKKHNPKLIIEVMNENLEAVLKFLGELSYTVISIKSLPSYGLYVYCKPSTHKVT